jgi:hypothetical protein
MAQKRETRFLRTSGVINLNSNNIGHFPYINKECWKHDIFHSIIMQSPFLFPPSIFANQHIDGAILFEKSDK